MTTLKTIAAGQTLTARSIGDYECIFSCEVVKRSNTFATVKIGKEEKRCKIHVYDGYEYIYALGQYSMAPMFKAN
jgi:hypothetical protein